MITNITGSRPAWLDASYDSYRLACPLLALCYKQVSVSGTTMASSSAGKASLPALHVLAQAGQQVVLTLSAQTVVPNRKLDVVQVRDGLLTNGPTTLSS